MAIQKLLIALYTYLIGHYGSDANDIRIARADGMVRAWVSVHTTPMLEIEETKLHNWLLKEGHEDATPSRKGLILGAMLVALHGEGQRVIGEFRHFNPGKDWNTLPGLAELKEIKKKLAAGEEVVLQPSDEVVALAAHTQQTLRVSYREWEDAVRLVY